VSLENFARGVKKVCSDGGVLLIAMLGGAVAGGFGGHAWVTEDWDNNPTDQTEQVMGEISQKISDLDVMDAKLTILNHEAENTAKKMGDDWKDSTKWEKYVVNKTRTEDNLKNQTHDLFSRVMTSPDITEEGLSSIINDFNAAHIENSDINFPRNGLTYAFKECQAEVASNVHTKGLDAKADAIGQCAIDKTINDSLGMLFMIPGMFGGILELLILGGVAGAVANGAANRGQRKKQQKRRPN
jgi:hypothetical protein